MTLPKVNSMDQKSSSQSAAAVANMEFASAEVQSTISSSDMPPAYQRPASESLKLAKVVSKTLLAITAILSCLVLISIYIQANGRCACHGKQAARSGPYFEPLIAESETQERKKLPLSIQMAGSAGDLMKKMNTKGHVNCVVERKVANQIIASEPKTLITPYGNITTDPRLIHLTGEKMVFTCNSANKDMPNKKDKLRNELLGLKDKDKDDDRDKDNDSNETRFKRSADKKLAVEKKECLCECPL